MVLDMKHSALWRWMRKRRILKCHERTAAYWKPLIREYYMCGERFKRLDWVPKKQLSDKRIIWQYWGQGLDCDDLPEIVRICFASVDKYKSDFQVIRLTDESISDYVDFPPFVWERLKGGNYSRTAFSDLLRLALLRLYGGVWLDATILLTDSLPLPYSDSDFFIYQRSSDVLDKRYWENIYAYYWGWYPGFRVNCLSSIIYAQPNSKTLVDWSNLLLHYWEKEERVIDYFFFQILFDCLMEEKPELNCRIVSDCIPHLLQMKVNGHFPNYAVRDILRQTSIHKMSYFDEKALSYLKREVLGLEE